MRLADLLSTIWAGSYSARQPHVLWSMRVALPGTLGRNLLMGRRSASAPLVSCALLAVPRAVPAVAERAPFGAASMEADP
jgi:hypothetical protein